MRDADVAEQLRQTAQLIAREPTTLVLSRRTAAPERTPAGGVNRGGDWEPQDPITVFFGAKSRDGLPLQDTQGERVIQYYTIVGEPGLDIKVNDTFKINNTTYKVTFVHDNLPYEVKADVEAVSGGYS